MQCWNKAPISVPQSPVLFQSTRTTSRYLSCCDRRSEAQLLLLSSVCTVKPSGLRTWLLLHCVFWLMLPSRDKTGELRGNCSEVWQNLLTSSRNGSPGLAHHHAVHSPNALRPIALHYIHLQFYITIKITLPLESFLQQQYSCTVMIKLQNLQHYSRIQSFISVEMECVGWAKREVVTFSGADPNYGMVTWIFANIVR